MKTICASISKPNQSPPEGTRLAVFAGVEADMIRSRDNQAFFTQAANYAACHHVYLVPGLYVQENQLWLCLLDDSGQVILEQPATHLNRSWAGDLQRGNEIHVAETPFGRVALCVDVDIYKSEVLRIAALQGAEIVISCQYIRAEDGCREMVLAGAWQQAQQNCLYILNSSNLNACILGPCETAADKSGFLTEISRDYPLQAELSAPRRVAAYRGFPIFLSLNPGLYERHAAELRK